MSIEEIMKEVIKIRIECHRCGAVSHRDIGPMTVWLRCPECWTLDIRVRVLED